MRLAGGKLLGQALCDMIRPNGRPLDATRNIVEQAAAWSGLTE
jgi:hypothetical protein